MTTTSKDKANEFYEFERAGWERVAADYHRFFANLTTRFIEPLLDAADVKAGQRVLDVASGPGYVAAAAAQRGADVVGIDFAEAAVAVARRQYPAILFQTGSAEDLPFPGSQFDAVVMNFGLLHVAQPERALAEANRVLNAGGRVAYSVWSDPKGRGGFQDHSRRHLPSMGTMTIPLPDGPAFFRFSDPAESTRALIDAGFTAPSVEEVRITWELPHEDALFETFLHGAVRTGALLKAQTPQAQADIRRAVRDGVVAFAEEGRICLPMAAVISSRAKAMSSSEVFAASNSISFTRAPYGSNLFCGKAFLLAREAFGCYLERRHRESSSSNS